MWQYFMSRSKIDHTTDRRIAQRWNAQHIQKWLSRHEDPLHSLSVIDHVAVNSHSGLAITEDRELIFGRDKGLGLYITCDQDPDFWLYTGKFRFFHDLYLHFEACGYKIKECSLDEPLFSTTIPASKYSRDVVVAEAPAEEVERDIDAYYEVDSDDIVLHRRPAVASAKRGRRKAFPWNGVQAAKLLKRRAVKKQQKARCFTKRRARADKQWRLAELDSVYQVWQNGIQYFFDIWPEYAAELEVRASRIRSRTRSDSYSDYIYVYGDDYEYETDYERLYSMWHRHPDGVPLGGILEYLEPEEVGEGGVLEILGLYASEAASASE